MNDGCGWMNPRAFEHLHEQACAFTGRYAGPNKGVFFRWPPMAGTKSPKMHPPLPEGDAAQDTPRIFLRLSQHKFCGGDCRCVLCRAAAVLADKPGLRCSVALQADKCAACMAAAVLSAAQDKDTAHDKDTDDADWAHVDVISFVKPPKRSAKLSRFDIHLLAARGVRRSLFERLVHDSVLPVLRMASDPTLELARDALRAAARRRSAPTDSHCARLLELLNAGFGPETPFIRQQLQVRVRTHTRTHVRTHAHTHAPSHAPSQHRTIARTHAGLGEAASRSPARR